MQDANVELRVRALPSDHAARVRISYTGPSTPPLAAPALALAHHGVSGPANNPTVLLDGQSVVEFVDYHLTNYYIYTVAPGALIRVDISCTPIYGDSDVYVSLNGNVPGSSNYQYYSASLFGTDTVTIRGTDPQVSVLPAHTHTHTHKNTHTRMYALAI